MSAAVIRRERHSGVNRAAAPRAGRPSRRGDARSLLQRRERGRREDLVFLRDEPVTAARRWPRPSSARRRAPACDCPCSSRPRCGRTRWRGRTRRGRRTRSGRASRARRSRTPPLRQIVDRSRLDRVIAQLVDRAQLAGVRLRDEREQDDDLGAHLTDELLDLRRPVRFFRRLAPHPRAIGKVLVPPDVDDLVEQPHLDVQERRQLGIFLAVLVGVAEALLDLGQATRSDGRCESRKSR